MVPEDSFATEAPFTKDLPRLEVGYVCSGETVNMVSRKVVEETFVVYFVLLMDYDGLRTKMIPESRS